MFIHNLVSALALVTLLPSAFAYPYLQERAGAFKVTKEQLLKIAPKSASCAPADTECTPAEKAVPFINNSFEKYKITSPAVAAALLATMALESLDFKYSRNKTPGRPGQGTRNMQMASFNKEYLQSIPELKAQASDDIVKNLNLLIYYGDLNFGSAAWFLTTKCPDQVANLASGKQDAFVKGYLGEKCIQAGNDPKDMEPRITGWKNAMEALGAKAT